MKKILLEEKELITIETEMGKIELPKSVIGNVVMDVVDSFDGKVILSDSKGRIHKLAYRLGAMEEANNIEIEANENSIDLRVYAILRFGVSIRETSKQLINELKETIKEATGIRVDNVSIVVTGMLSRKIAPRNIEVTG